jgi:hypothetical protein
MFVSLFWGLVWLVGFADWVLLRCLGSASWFLDAAVLALCFVVPVSGLFLAFTLLVSCSECIVVLGVSLFPASIDAGASLTGLAIPQASRCGCQFSRCQKLLFCCPHLFLPWQSVLCGRNVGGGAAVVLPLFEDGQPMCSPAP